MNIFNLLQQTTKYYTSPLLRLLGRKTVKGKEVARFSIMRDDLINTNQIHYISGKSIAHKALSQIIMHESVDVLDEFDNIETFLKSTMETREDNAVLVLLSNPTVLKDKSGSVSKVLINDLVQINEMRTALQQFMPIFKVIKQSVYQQEVQEIFTEKTELTSEIKKVNSKQEYFFILARILRYYMTVFVNNIKESNLNNAIKLAQETTDAKFFTPEAQEDTLNVKLMSTLNLYLQKAKDKSGILEALTTNDSYLIGTLKGLAQKYSCTFNSVQQAIHSILTLGSIRCTSYVQGTTTTLFNVFDTTDARHTKDVINAFNAFMEEDLIKALVQLKQDAKLNISKEVKKQIKAQGVYTVQNTDGRVLTIHSMNASTTRKIVQHLTGGFTACIVKKFRGIFKEQKAASIYNAAFGGNWTFMLNIIKKNAERVY